MPYRGRGLCSDLHAFREHAGQDLLGELGHLGVESLEGSILLGLEGSESAAELSVNLGLGGGKLLGGLSRDDSLGISHLLLGGGTGLTDDLLGLSLQLGDLTRVVLHHGELLAEGLVTVVEQLADGGEPALLQEDHEEEELGSHHGGGQVEIEDLTGLGVSSEGKDGIGQHSHGDRLQHSGKRAAKGEGNEGGKVRNWCKIKK